MLNPKLTVQHVVWSPVSQASNPQLIESAPDLSSLPAAQAIVSHVAAEGVGGAGWLNYVHTPHSSGLR